MDDKIKTYLFDIKQAIIEIDSFFPTVKNFDTFKEDMKTKRAVERNIEIIGEAIYRIMKSDSKIKISNSQKIIDTRNRIIHGYDTVSYEIIWGNHKTLTYIKIRNNQLIKQKIKNHWTLFLTFFGKSVKKVILKNKVQKCLLKKCKLFTINSIMCHCER